MSWYLFSEQFINKGLVGEISYENVEKRLLISKLIFYIQPVIFFLMSIPCRIPIIDQLCEFISTHWSRGLIGFVLRGVYWKTKIGEMGQDVFIDKNVTIYPDTKSVFIGNNVNIDVNVTIQIYQGLLIIGDNSQILYNSYLNCRPYIILGKDVVIGNSCILYGGSTSLLDEDGKFLPWSSMNPKHRDLLCGIIFEDYSGLVNNVICCPDPWSNHLFSVDLDYKGTLNLKPLTIRKYTGVCSNTYIDKSTGEAEMWAGNPAKMIFDYKVKIDRKLKEGVNLLEYVE